MTTTESTDATDRATLTVTDGLAELRLTRGKGNGIDLAMVEALAERVESVAADPRARALLITADGPAFSVGGDIRHLAAQADRLPAELDAMISTYHRTLGRLAALTIPVVVAVRGPVAGGGLGLVWSADIVVAADDMRIVTGFALLGLSGDGGSSWHLPRLVGLRRAQELIIGGRTLTAAEALDWGLVTRVVPAAELADEAGRQARALADGPTFCYGRMRQLLLNSPDRTYREQLEAERGSIIECARTDDAREGLAAFLARRPPVFRGH